MESCLAPRGYFLWQFFKQPIWSCIRNRECHVENSSVYAPEITLDSGNTHDRWSGQRLLAWTSPYLSLVAGLETIATLWVYANFSVTSRVHKRTVACDNFSLTDKSHKNGHASFQQMDLSHKIRTKVLMYTAKTNGHKKLVTENVIVWILLYALLHSDSINTELNQSNTTPAKIVTASFYKTLIRWAREWPEFSLSCSEHTQVRDLSETFFFIFF